jgi:hypothetical protein
MKRTNILCLLALLLISVACKAQQLGERVTRTSVMIFNNSNEKLKFNLGVRYQQSKVYNISEYEKYVAGPFPVNSELLFTIGTDSTHKRYLLKLNNAYMIFWNNAGKYWDMRRLVW